MSNTSRKVEHIQTGNTNVDSIETRGWFVGSFLPKEKGLRYSDDLELKWGTHKLGEARKEWSTGEAQTTISILISGKFAVEFRNDVVNLTKPGDYVIWGMRIDHKWEAITDSVVLTVRWPSIIDK